MLGFDYTDRIAPAALKAAGCQVVFRYLSQPGWPKNLTVPEARELLAAGIAIVLNYETTANFMLGGFAGGVACARSARAQASFLGAPTTARIYYSADFDASAAQIPVLLDFARGAASVDGAAEVGVYGGLRVVRAEADAGFSPWQTVAWSGGVWDPRDVARQTGEQRTVGGVTVDVNQIINPSALGAWTAGGTVSLDKNDVMAVWSYSHGDAPDVHQTLGNAAAWAGAANAKLDQLLGRTIDPAALAAALGPLLHPTTDVAAFVDALVPHLPAAPDPAAFVNALLAHIVVKP